MATKFAEFLKERNLDPRRVLIASVQIERLRPEDRAIRLKERIARKSEDGPPPNKKDRVKPRSGRPLTPRALTAAMEGQTLSGPQKWRILRAINRIMEQKKLGAVDLKVLF